MPGVCNEAGRSTTILCVFEVQDFRGRCPKLLWCSQGVVKIADFGLSRSLAITQQKKHTGTSSINLAAVSMKVPELRQRSLQSAECIMAPSRALSIVSAVYDVRTSFSSVVGTPVYWGLGL